MYPTFLQREWHFSPERRSAITAFQESERSSEARFSATSPTNGAGAGPSSSAFILGALMIPLWAYRQTKLY